MSGRASTAWRLGLSTLAGLFMVLGVGILGTGSADGLVHVISPPTSLALYTYDTAAQHAQVTGESSGRFVHADSSRSSAVRWVGSVAGPSTTSPDFGVAAKTVEAGADAAKAEQYVYRIHGGESGPWGRSWTPENPQGMQNPRDWLGLPKENSGQMLTRARVRNTDDLTIRDALPIKEDGVAGGGPEWYFPNPSSQLSEQWTIPLVPPW